MKEIGIFPWMRILFALLSVWLDVDFANSRVLLPQTKNDDRRIAYLNQTAKAALESLLREHAASQALVFEGVFANYVKQTFRRACVDLGINDSDLTTYGTLRLAGYR